MLYTDLLNCDYHIKNNQIICPEQNIFIDIIAKKNDNVVLSTTLPNIRKIFINNPKFATVFNEFTNDLFSQEFNAIPDFCLNFIMEYDEQKNIELYNSVEYIIFTYNLKENELIASLLHNVKTTNDIVSLYIYALFSNPKYKRQGYCQNMITLLRNKNLKIYDEFIMKCSIYVWNIASIEMFKKLGFNIINVVQDSDVTQCMIDENKLKYICDYNGEKLHEAHLFILSQNVNKNVLK